jgi:hypothetical protein
VLSVLERHRRVLTRYPPLTTSTHTRLGRAAPYAWEQARGSGARSTPHASEHRQLSARSARLPEETGPPVVRCDDERVTGVILPGRRDLSDVLDDDAERPAMLDVEQRVVRLDQRPLPCIDAHVSMAMMMLI